MGPGAPTYRYLGMPRDDRRWIEVQWKTNWRLPEPGPWPARVWGVRHLRTAYYLMLNDKAVIGAQKQHEPPQYEYWVAYAMVRGWI